MLNNPSAETKLNVTDPDHSKDDGGDGSNPVEAGPPGQGMDVILRTIGHASSICECCGDFVDGSTLGGWIVADLDTIDYSDENHVFLCRNCYETEDWETRVRENRLDQQINSRLDKAIHWVTRPPVETMFLRRAAAGIALLITATAITTIMTALTSGLGSLWNSVTSPNWRLIAMAGTVLFGAGYWLHLHEREKNDRRGTTVGEHGISSGPWSVLAFASGGLAMGTAVISHGSSYTQLSLGLSIYLASAVFGFTHLETAVRADRCHRRVNWIPRYDRELFGLRISLAIGLFFLVTESTATIGALTPAIAIVAYLFARKWFDLGPNWQLLYYRGGDD